MPTDISKSLAKGGVKLEKAAKSKFGANVNTATDRLRAPSNTSASPSAALAGKAGVWDPTHYASALVMPDTVDFNPKLKFMFKVSFKINPSMKMVAQELGFDLDKLQQNLSFIVRHVDRPKFDFDYEEVNMYNFKTKVLKSIKHREVSLTIYDDVGNNALSFVNIYRQLLQPIARAKQDPQMQHEDFGFSTDAISTSMRSVLADGKKNILDEMIIHQIFVERGSDSRDPRSWVKVVNFTFMNPRFTNIDIDDLDHENGANFNIVTFSVDFDSVFMADPEVLSRDADGPSFGLGDIANGGRGDVSAAGGAQNKNMNAAFQQSGKVFSSSPYTELSDGGAPNVQSTRGIGGPVDKMLALKAQPSVQQSSQKIMDNTVPPSIARNLTRQTSSKDDLGDL